MNINGRMKVSTLKSQFAEEFGLTLRVYDGRSFADNDSTLASVRKGDAKGGEFSPRKNTKVGNLEDKIQELFGIKTQVAGSDDSYLCDDDFTLAAALEEDSKKVARKERKVSKGSGVDSGDDAPEDSLGTPSRLSIILKENEEKIYDIFERFEGKLQELNALSDHLEYGWDVTLSLEAYDFDGEESLKLIIDIQDDETDSLDDDVLEAISDYITDRLREKYSEPFAEMGIDLKEDLTWSPVALNED